MAYLKFYSLHALKFILVNPIHLLVHVQLICCVEAKAVLDHELGHLNQRIFIWCVHRQRVEICSFEVFV